MGLQVPPSQKREEAQQKGRDNTFLHTGLGYLRFYTGIENLILPMLSYPERQVTSSCEIAS